MGQGAPELSEALGKVAHQQGIRLGRRRLWPGLLVDHIPFAKAGFPAITLACAATKSMLIHTRYDTVSLVDKTGLQEVGQLIETWVRSLAEKKFQKK